jgi:heme-degrading monooxygenase HmoA
MYIAMNRFHIALGHEEAFETIWRNRETFLDEVPGFKEFHLLRGPSSETETLYASHSVWNAQSDFVQWTESDSFRKAHAKAHTPKGMHLSHPQLEGFEVVL